MTSDDAMDCLPHQVLLLDSALWARATPKAQRHWLQRLHGLLSEDEVGTSNASYLVDAGMLDSMMTLLASGRLLAGGCHLLAARLVLRTWHSVQFSMEVTRRVHDFLAATARPQHADVQLLCVRMLARMVEHASTSLGEAVSSRAAASAATRAVVATPAAAGEPAPPAESAGVHAGARAVLAVLQPPLLLSFLQPEHGGHNKVLVAAVMRLIVNLLLLSQRYPEHVTFAKQMGESRGFEKLFGVLPLHAGVPDVYLSLLALATNQTLDTVENKAPPETAEQLAEACALLQLT
jgi:hypothetical protein